ncbi:hypothetical protein ADUPG1_000469, partial [Aduncisulcus paluster]
MNRVEYSKLDYLFTDRICVFDNDRQCRELEQFIENHDDRFHINEYESINRLYKYITEFFEIYLGSQSVTDSESKNPISMFDDIKEKEHPTSILPSQGTLSSFLPPSPPRDLVVRFLHLSYALTEKLSHYPPLSFSRSSTHSHLDHVGECLASIGTLFIDIILEVIEKFKKDIVETDGLSSSKKQSSIPPFFAQSFVRLYSTLVTTIVTHTYKKKKVSNSFEYSYLSESDAVVSIYRNEKTLAQLIKSVHICCQGCGIDEQKDDEEDLKNELIKRPSSMKTVFPDSELRLAHSPNHSPVTTPRGTEHPPLPYSPEDHSHGPLRAVELREKEQHQWKNTLTICVMSQLIKSVHICCQGCGIDEQKDDEEDLKNELIKRPSSMKTVFPDSELRLAHSPNHSPVTTPRGTEHPPLPYSPEDHSHGPLRAVELREKEQHQWKNTLTICVMCLSGLFICENEEEERKEEEERQRRMKAMSKQRSSPSGMDIEECERAEPSYSQDDNFHHSPLPSSLYRRHGICASLARSFMVKESVDMHAERLRILAEKKGGHEEMLKAIMQELDEKENKTMNVGVTKVVKKDQKTSKSKKIGTLSSTTLPSSSSDMKSTKKVVIPAVMKGKKNVEGMLGTSGVLNAKKTTLISTLVGSGAVTSTMTIGQTLNGGQMATIGGQTMVQTCVESGKVTSMLTIPEGTGRMVSGTTKVNPIHPSQPPSVSSSMFMSVCECVNMVVHCPSISLSPVLTPLFLPISSYSLYAPCVAIIHALCVELAWIYGSQIESQKSEHEDKTLSPCVSSSSVLSFHVCQSPQQLSVSTYMAILLSHTEHSVLPQEVLVSMVSGFVYDGKFPDHDKDQMDGLEGLSGSRRASRIESSSGEPLEANDELIQDSFLFAHQTSMLPPIPEEGSRPLSSHLSGSVSAHPRSRRQSIADVPGSTHAESAIKTIPEDPNSNPFIRGVVAVTASMTGDEYGRSPSIPGSRSMRGMSFAECDKERRMSTSESESNRKKTMFQRKGYQSRRSQEEHVRQGRMAMPKPNPGGLSNTIQAYTVSPNVTGWLSNRDSDALCVVLCLKMLHMMVRVPESRPLGLELLSWKPMSDVLVGYCGVCNHFHPPSLAAALEDPSNEAWVVPGSCPRKVWTQNQMGVIRKEVLEVISMVCTCCDFGRPVKPIHNARKGSLLSKVNKAGFMDSAEETEIESDKNEGYNPQENAEDMISDEPGCLSKIPPPPLPCPPSPFSSLFFPLFKSLTKSSLIPSLLSVLSCSDTLHSERIKAWECIGGCTSGGESNDSGIRYGFRYMNDDVNSSGPFGCDPNDSGLPSPSSFSPASLFSLDLVRHGFVSLLINHLALCVDWFSSQKKIDNCDHSIPLSGKKRRRKKIDQDIFTHPHSRYASDCASALPTVSLPIGETLNPFASMGSGKSHRGIHQSLDPKPLDSTSLSVMTFLTEDKENEIDYEYFTLLLLSILSTIASHVNGLPLNEDIMSIPFLLHTKETWNTLYGSCASLEDPFNDANEEGQYEEPWKSEEDEYQHPQLRSSVLPGINVGASRASGDPSIQLDDPLIFPISQHSPHTTAESAVVNPTLLELISSLLSLCPTLSIVSMCVATMRSMTEPTLKWSIMALKVLTVSRNR